MLPNAQRLITSAVRNKRRVLIRYDGRSQSRVVEPHILYRSEAGNLTMVGYQVRGYHSSKRRGSFWRPFQLRKIDSMHVLDEVFEPRLREGYSAVAATIRGALLAKLESKENRYTYLSTELQGPPTPAYLAATPTLMLRMANKTGVTGTDQASPENSAADKAKH